MQQRRWQLVIITSLRAATTRRLAPAPAVTQEERFKAFFLPPRCLLDSRLARPPLIVPPVIVWLPPSRPFFTTKPWPLMTNARLSRSLPSLIIPPVGL